MRVYLTGFMGAGKSTVGELLAQELDCAFIDLDLEVETAAGQTVSEIFATSGELRFRQLEDQQLHLTVEVERCVVATGGGTPLEAANRRWMREHGSIVWLAVPFDELRERSLDSSERPLWLGVAHARALFERRLEIYRDCDLVIETTGSAPRTVVAAVVEGLEAVGLR